MQYITIAISVLLIGISECFASADKAITAKQPSTVVTTTTTLVHVSPSNSCTWDNIGQDPPSAPHCLSLEKANYFVDSFKSLLEFTDYDGSHGGPKGRGFNTNLANKILAEDFQDFSDSINLLAQQPLGSVTFPNRAAFIAGQSAQPEVAVTILNVWFNCSTITFRYRLITSLGPNLPILGINVMELNEELEQVKTQYAEFNSGAWLADLGNPECQK